MVSKRTLTRSREFLDSIIDSIREPLIALDQDLRVVTASRSFYDFFKVNPEETVGQLIYDLGNKQWDIPKLRELLETILPQKTTFDNYEVEHDFATIGRRIMLLNARPIQRVSGKERIILLTIEDITERKRAESVLRESDERYKALFDRSLDLVYLYDFEGRFIDANAAALNRLGYTKEDIRSLNFASLLSEDQLPLAFKTLQEIQETGIQKELVEFRLRHKNGSEVFVETKGSTIMSNGIPVALQSIARDITERKRVESVLNRSETKFRTLYDSTSDAVMLLDEKGFFDCNKATLKIFGCATREEFCTKHPADLSPPQQTCGTDSMVLANRMIATAIEKGGIQFEWIHKRNDTGKTFPADVLLTAMELDGKAVVQAVVRDITERKRYQENLEYFAVHDALTGLLNRHSLEEMLNRTIARAKRGVVSSLLCMDLDNFKDVNDTVGHAAGDEVLKTLSGLLKSELRTEDSVFRLGGDEFAVLLDGMDSRETLHAAERLRAVVEAYCFELDRRVFPLSLSIGLIEIDGTLAMGELLSQADAAMYRAKEQGKNRIVQSEKTGGIHPEGKGKTGKGADRGHSSMFPGRILGYSAIPRWWRSA